MKKRPPAELIATELAEHGGQTMTDAGERANQLVTVARGFANLAADESAQVE